jgi:3-oxoacyl-[acyl-carrier protein] reductase
MIDPQIEGKVVLITGANHGIGAAAARAFAVQGARSYLTYFREPCEYTSAQLKDAGESGSSSTAAKKIVLLFQADVCLEKVLGATDCSLTMR